MSIIPKENFKNKGNVFSLVLAILALLVHILRRILYPNPKIIEIEYECTKHILEDSRIIDGFLLPSSRLITINDEPKSNTCSVVER